MMATKVGHFIFQGHDLKNTGMFALDFILEVECNIFLHIKLIVKSILSNKLYLLNLKKPMCF